MYRGYLKGRVSKREYTWFKNKVTNAIRKTKALYYAQLFLQNANNSKALWSSINSVMNKNDPKTLREIKMNGEILTGRVLADYVNQYFVNTADNVTVGLPKIQGFICLSA